MLRSGTKKGASNDRPRGPDALPTVRRIAEADTSFEVSRDAASSQERGSLNRRDVCTVRWWRVDLMARPSVRGALPEFFVAVEFDGGVEAYEIHLLQSRLNDEVANNLPSALL